MGLLFQFKYITGDILIFTFRLGRNGGIFSAPKVTFCRKAKSCNKFIVVYNYITKVVPSVRFRDVSPSVKSSLCDEEPFVTRQASCRAPPPSYNIVVLLVIHFAILLIVPRAYCSLHLPPAALTNAHPPYQPYG